MNKLLEYFHGDELAASTWKNKYAWRGEETPDDTHKRLAKEFFRIERYYQQFNLFSSNDKIHSRIYLSPYGHNRKDLTEKDIFDFFKNFGYIIPGGSVMAGCGTSQLASLSNCFVIGSPEDSYSDIMKTRNFQVQLMKRRGGVGYDLSGLRPRGATVNNAAKTSTGAASFMDVCSDITNEVSQMGRRGALMLSMSINHPDIEEFITKKQDLTKVTGANISVKVTDEFMKAVEKDEDYLLRFPIDQDLSYFSKDYLDVEYNELVYLEDHKNNNNIFYIKKIKAKELWNTLIHCAWNTAEPGIMFEDTIHDYAPDGVYKEFRAVSTNPCGEIPMGAMDSCRLMHINLTSFVNNPFTENAMFDMDKFYKICYEATRLSDDLIDLEIEAINSIIDVVKNDSDSTEFNLWNRIKKTATSGRRIGLGFTGLADMLAMLDLDYASDKSLYMIEKIMYLMLKAELDSTIDMAIERGAFPAWNKELECILSPTGSNKWYKFISEKYMNEYQKMMMFGRRNLSFSTVAPTGTVSIMAQCSSGIEPVFMPFYERKRKCMSSDSRVDYIDKLGEKYTLFTVVHPNLKKWVLINAKSPVIHDILPKEIVSGNLEWYIDNNWTLKEWETAFKYSPYYQSTASDINWNDRIKLQGIVQKYITHSISSTINLSEKTTEQEISDIYMKAWILNNKGQTVYRNGCREGILNKVVKPELIKTNTAPKRPKTLEADYYQVKIKGEQFIVLVGLFNDKPYEVFTFRPLRTVNVPFHKGTITKISKMHYCFNSQYIKISDLQLANENIEEKAATLYSSMLLRHGVDIEYIIKTAKKINDNITSFSSAMCRILSKYIKKDQISSEHCPECNSLLLHEGGCLICKNCGYSKCS